MGKDWFTSLRKTLLDRKDFMCFPKFERGPYHPGFGTTGTTGSFRELAELRQAVFKS